LSKDQPKREVAILDDREIVTFPKLNVPVKQHIVVYQLDPYPPRTVFILSDQYSDKALKDAINKDIAEMEKSKPRTMTL